MAAEELTLGEYLRRSRRAKKWSLLKLSEETGVSYSHLSRIENDSGVPKAETVTKLANALDGDLKLMLELAGNLPKQILDRITSERAAPGTPSLRRAAWRNSSSQPPPGSSDDAASLAQSLGLDVNEAAEAGDAILRFLKLDRRQRDAIAALIESYEAPDGE